MSTLDQERREWAAQERAVREESAGAPSSGDRRVAEYRLIARALREPPLEDIPEDFAAQIAALARHRAAADDRDRLEARLQAALLVLLVSAGALSIGLFDGEWPRALVSALQAPVAAGVRTFGSWLGAIAACLAFSWLMERGLRRFRRGV